MNNAPQLVNQNDEYQKIILILLSIFGVICVFTLGATLAMFYTINTAREEQKSTRATQQANATSTAVSQETQVAGYEFFDDFTNNSNHWSTGEDSNDFWYGVLSIEDGMYVWKINKFHKNNAVNSWRTYDDNVPVEDFDVSVDAKLSTPESNNICYAIAFRVSPKGLSDGGYVFSVCDDQQFIVEYENNVEGDILLKSWTPSQTIRSGDWNTLAVNARGDHFILSINNVVVFEFTDTKLPRGYVYLMLDIYDTVPGTIMFDNFGLQTR